MCCCELVAIFPAGLALIAYFMFAGYPINEEMHNRIRTAVTDMHAKSKEQRAALARGGAGHRQSVSSRTEGRGDAVAASEVLAAPLTGTEKENENEAIPLTVEDPVTRLMMPIPKPDYTFSELDVTTHGDSAAAAAGASDANGAGLKAPLLSADVMPVPSTPASVAPPSSRRRGSLLAAKDALDEWLMDFFSARELHVANHLGVSRLRTEIIASTVVWIIGMILLGVEGTLLFLASSHYVSLIWVLGSATCSVLCFLDIMRIPAVGRLAEIPGKTLHAMVTHHCEQLARFSVATTNTTGSNPTHDSNMTTPADRVVQEVSALKSTNWQYISWSVTRAMPFLMAVAGYFILTAKFVSDS